MTTIQDEDDMDSEIRDGKVWFRITNAVCPWNLLSKDQRVQELFFVIDNTGYADAVKSNKNPEKVTDGSNDIYMKVDFKYEFTSNDKYFVWTFFFGIILASLMVILLLSCCLYTKMNYDYNRHAKERKALKQQLLKAKDTEYANFNL